MLVHVGHATHGVRLGFRSSWDWEWKTRLCLVETYLAHSEVDGYGGQRAQKLGG